MANKMGYMIDLTSLQFDEQTDGGASSWIQAMPLGKYQHPVYGDIDITPERVTKFAENVNNGVRGQELDIDYDHKAHNGKAAGWVKQAVAKLTEADPKQNGLWILVDWVADAYADIKNKAYKYFSPEFDDSWTDPRTGQEFTDVLFGGGITNRPFLKGILPLNLSEIFAESTTESKTMFTDDQRADLIKRFNLADDASDEVILGVLMSKLAPDKPEDNNPPPVQASQDAALPQQVATLSEDEVKQLSENPVTKKLLGALDGFSKKFKEMEDEATVTKLDEALRAKGLAMSPVAKDAFRDTVKLSENPQISGAMVQFATKLVDGIVKLNESGAGSGVHRQVETDPTKQLSERATAIASERKISFGEAMAFAVNENPDLYDSHRTNSYLG